MLNNTIVNFPRDMELSNYTILHFCRDMDPFNLSYRGPRAEPNMWVFWSKGGEVEGEGADLDSVTETLANKNWGNVQEYLKSALGNAKYIYGDNVLIQFWAPTTTSSMSGGHCVLTTSNQPFGIYRIERGVCEYRKHCTSFEINVFQDDYGSIIGQVFRDKEEEECTDDYMLGDFAHKCGIRRSFFLPLFKPPSRCCSGVLEISDTSESSIFLVDPITMAKAIIEEANIMKPSPFESEEIEEINKALQGVCTTQQLPLAQIWIPCCTSTAMAYVDCPGDHCHSPYLSCSNKFSSSISHSEVKSFNISSTFYNFRKGESIVGKALLYHKPCFCRDVTQLPEAEYPLSNAACMYGLTGCCAIWLHSTCTKNRDYVLEFFLPPWNTISRDPQGYMELLLATVKKQLPGFKITSVGEESCVKVCEIFVNDNEPDSVVISQTFSVKPAPESFANEKEVVQNEVVGEIVIDYGSNILCLEQNGIVVCHSEKIAVEAAMNDEITIRLPPVPESLRNENEVVQQQSDDEPTMEEGVRKNELNVAIVKQTSEAVTSSERIFSRAEASEREYRTTDFTLSYEDLIKHFGKKLDDAAQILGVSRSTVKRACRLHNIGKWPVPKRKKVNALRVRSGNEGIEGNSKGDPSCSDLPPMPATAGISHKTSNSREEQDVGKVTLKVTHGNDTFRFKLPFSSRKADLVEKLKTRVSLNEGSFNMKYQDEENEWISIACDEDLAECIDIWKGKSKIIKMLVEPITNQAP
ncbi:hypothetical protein LguiB_012748 [Lonicera macranthoides]